MTETQLSSDLATGHTTDRSAPTGLRPAVAGLAMAALATSLGISGSMVDINVATYVPIKATTRPPDR
jgi:hypothetical protein